MGLPRRDGFGGILFGLLGYRLWWSFRSPFARPRSDMDGLIVIGGSPRSGTTLLRSMLGRHPQIFSGPETTVFLHRISSPADIGDRLDCNPVEIETWQRKASSQMEFIELCAQNLLARAGKKFWAEKTPHNVKRFGFVRRHFPRAKLVHVVRDGRDVICSLRRTPFSKVDGACWDSTEAAQQCALQWKASVTAGLRFRGDPAYHEVRYEELVRDPESVLRALLAFMGVPWDAAMLEAGKRPARPDPYEPRASNQIFDSSIGRWQRDLSAADWDVVALSVEPLLKVLGYMG